MITMKAPSGGRTSAMLAWAEVRTSDGQDEMSKQGGNHIMENKPTSFPVEMTYFVRRVTFDGYRIEPRTIDDLNWYLSQTVRAGCSLESALFA